MSKFARPSRHERPGDAEGRREHARVADVDDAPVAAEGLRGDDLGLEREARGLHQGTRLSFTESPMTLKKQVMPSRSSAAWKLPGGLSMQTGAPVGAHWGWAT
jgi:hypothetical protein